MSASGAELAPIRLGAIQYTRDGLIITGEPSWEQCRDAWSMLMRLRDIAHGRVVPAWQHEGSGVYALVNPKTLEAYIGSSVNVARRHKVHSYLLRKGRHSNQHLQRSWDKHGEFGAFVLEPTEPTRASLLEAEQRWIDFWGRLYNVSPVAGRPGVRVFTEEHRRKISQSKKGQTITAEQRAQISATLKGRVMPPGQREAMIAGVRRHYTTAEARERSRQQSIESWRKASPEERRRRVAGMRKWADSPEGRAVLAASNRRESLSPERLEALRASAAQARAAKAAQTQDCK